MQTKLGREGDTWAKLIHTTPWLKVLRRVKKLGMLWWRPVTQHLEDRRVAKEISGSKSALLNCIASSRQRQHWLMYLDIAMCAIWVASEVTLLGLSKKRQVFLFSLSCSYLFVILPPSFFSSSPSPCSPSLPSPMSEAIGSLRRIFRLDLRLLR